MRFLFPFIVVALAANAPAQVLTASKLLSGSATDAATAVAVDPQGNVFLAGTTTSPDFPIVNGLVPRIPEAALRLSADGKTFAPSNLTASQITAIAASSDGRTVLAANAASIYRSIDAGATWSAAPVTIPGYTAALAIDPVNASNAYALANLNGATIFYRSADGGLTWQSSSPAGTQQQASTPRILIDPQNPASIYAYLGNGLNHSSDSGVTWQRVTVSGSPVPGNPAVPVAFAIAPSQPQTLYAVTNFGPSEKSSDGGATWQSTASLATTSAYTLAVDPHNPDVIWFTDAHGIELSTDGGATVQNVAKIGDGAWQGIAIDPADSSHIFAADVTSLYASLDGGATWQAAATGQFNGVLATPLAIFATGAIRPTLFLAKLDPTLTHVIFSTFLGAIQQRAIALVVDAAGNPMVTGATQSADFPTTANALEPTAVFTSGATGFAVKVRGDDGAFLYSTFLNGFEPHGAAFDSSGNAVIVGAAQPGLPTSANAFQAAVTGRCTRIALPLNIIPPSQSGHAYAAKISADGASLLSATYFTGACGDTANAVQLDAAGNIFITGYTLSPDFPLTANAVTAAFPSGAYASGFVAELPADGARLLYSSFFGGGEYNSGNAIALDARGNVYVGGYTQTTASAGVLAVADPNGCEYVINIGPSVDESYNYIDGFVMKLAPNGAPPAFFATIGGGCSDSVQSLSLDGSGNIWVGGTTVSADFPTRAPIGALGVGQGGFAAEIDPSGSSLLFSTLSGSSAGIAPAVAATRTGAYLASSITDPSKPGATAAFAGFIDGAQAPAIALDSIQTPSITPQRLPPIFIPPTIAPGQLLILNGRGIGPSDTVNAKLTAGGAFPTSLEGVQVLFNGTAAPLVSVQANRIECQAPFELDGATAANIHAQYNGQPSNTFAAAVVPQQLSLLAASNADGTANSAANPAAIGSTVTIYMTGVGQTTPGGVDGALNATASITPRAVPQVSVNYANTQPAFFGAAPGESSGVFQMNVVAPALLNGVSTVPVSLYGPSGFNAVAIQLYVK